MNKIIRVFQVDSFTKEVFSGNPAGVVLNADGLTDDEMLKIARELNNSETSFILSPDDPGHEVKVRFFTPTVEVPSCGHATIAAHYVRALVNDLPDCEIIQKIGAGILPVQIKRVQNDILISMTQGKIVFEEPLSQNAVLKITDALGISSKDLLTDAPVQIVSTGHSKVLIGVKSEKTVNEISPQLIKLSEISKEINCNGYFVFAFKDDKNEGLTTGRMFAPAIGISEDPVTGNANGPLGAYLVKHKLVSFSSKIPS